MNDDGVYTYYALKDPATNLYFSGPVDGIWKFEVKPTVDSSGRITKFNSEKMARLAIHEMMDLMGDDIYDDGEYDPASYEIVLFTDVGMDIESNCRIIHNR